jgi:DNA-binding PadR family transcriptional regulator
MGIIGHRKKKILEEIKNNPSHGYVISKNLKIPISSIYEHLKDLRENGLVKFRQEKRRKVYRLTKKGEMLLKALV